MEEFAVKCYNTAMRILSGIRATGALHIGNYLGAIQQWIELQNIATAFYMIADLHAITTPFDAKQLPDQVRVVAAEYLAAGLDPKKATLFVQSAVPAHAELAWLLNTLTATGDLERMTQFKEKVQQGAPTTSGLFTYPVLMAADILLYHADHVPVGDDQVQHVELARTLARKFNRQFGKTLIEPQPLLSEGRRVLSFRDPSKKMSKTNDEPLYLCDEPKVIQAKLARAVTATTGGGKNPGVENLFVLLRTFSPPNVVADFEAAEKNGTIRYADLKTQLANDIAEHFADFRKRRAALLKDPATIDDVLTDGAKRANAVADATLAEVYTKTGLRS